METSEETLHIDTPENVAFGYEVAGIGSRFLAALVDTLLILILEGFIGLAVILADNYFSGALGPDSRLIAWLIAGVGLLLFFVFWGYYIFFELLWNGQTPGKRLAGLRVIRANGAPITLPESAIRNLVRLIDFLPTFYGLGVVVMFIDRQSRRLGDLAAGTLVVRDQANVTLESLAASPLGAAAAKRETAFRSRLAVQASPFVEPSSAAAVDATVYPVHLLSPGDMQLAEDFLRRRSELFNRQDIAERIARSLAERMRLEEAFQPAEAERLIEQVVHDARAKAAE